MVKRLYAAMTVIGTHRVMTTMKATLLAMLLSIGLTSTSTVGQQAPSRRDIPSIAKAANGSIVSIVMSDKNGKPIAQGTGFVVTKDGLIVTNYHVIAEGSSAVAKLPDGATYFLEGVVASDKERDVAVVRATGKNFRPLPLGNSDRVEVGQEVVAIGNPLSLESTVSNGIISGIRTADNLGGRFLQVTAPISPGSSGGPLFNMAGEVVGITTLYLKGGENLNFAIPINDAKRQLVDPYAKYGGSVAPSAWPNEPHPDEEGSAQQQKDNGDAAHSASTNGVVPDLKTTVEFMGRMVEPEHRDVLQGVLEGAILHSANGPAVTILAHQSMMMVFTTGLTHKNGYPEFTYSIVSDGDGKHEQMDYPRYVSFALGDIDPSSIEAKVGGYDPYALSEFWDKHPRCEANPECSHEFLGFLDSAPKLTTVEFHTTDLKPLIERGGCAGSSGCALTETTGSVLIFFKSKDRAERFVTALSYAVKSAGGKPDLFPPTHYSKKD